MEYQGSTNQRGAGMTTIELISIIAIAINLVTIFWE
jgi:hypothetical protein